MRTLRHDQERHDQEPSSVARRHDKASEVAEPTVRYGAEMPGISSEALGGSLSREVALQVLAKLEDLEASYATQGRSMQELGTPEALAERMVATLPAPSPWAELGPFYSTNRVAKLLGGVSRQAIADRRKRGTLLALRTADDIWVYPEFQFDEHHKVLPGLPEVVRILRGSELDDWTLAGWLSSPMHALDRRSPVEWLRQGEALEPLLTLARDAARRFAQ